VSRAVFVIGESGSGKSSAIRTLNPSDTFVINALNKDLPFKGSAKNYTLWHKEKNPDGNLVITANSEVVLKWLQHIDAKMPHIKNIIIDDNTFLTSLELLRRSRETTWEKYTDIANNFVALANVSKSLRDDIVVYILHHTKEDGDGLLEEKTNRAMSYGKLIDEKLCSQEAQFTIVLLAKKENTDNGLEYVFYTRDAHSTAKAPHGMFENDKIPNDFEYVRKAIECFYDDNGC